MLLELLFQHLYFNKISKQYIIYCGIIKTKSNSIMVKLKFHENSSISRITLFISIVTFCNLETKYGETSSFK